VVCGQWSVATIYSATDLATDPRAPTTDREQLTTDHGPLTTDY